MAKLGSVIRHFKNHYVLIIDSEGKKYLARVGRTDISSCTVVFKRPINKYVLYKTSFKEGDEMIGFEMKDVKSGQVFIFWCPLPQEAKEKILSEGEYRLMKYLHVPGTDYNEKYATCDWQWKGNFVDMAISYPRSMADYFSCDDFDTHTWLEKLTSEEWIKTADLRPTIDSL